MTEKVDSMCVRAAKCGTSRFYHVLRQHSDVFIPKIKEIHCFKDRHPEASEQFSIGGNLFLQIQRI